MRQSPCLVFNPIMVDNYAAGGSGVRLYDGPDIKLFILVGLGRSFGAFCLLLDPPGFKWCFSFVLSFSKLFGAQVSPSSGSLL